MRTLKNLLIGVGIAATWPAYLGLAAYAARQAPWPRSVAVPLSAALAFVALASLAANVARWACRSGGWAEDVLEMPREVTSQVRLAAVALAGACVLTLLPGWLLSSGLIAPGGRPASGPTVVRGLILAFELSVLVIAFRVLRRKSALVVWLAQSPEQLGGLARHSRLACTLALAGIAAVIVLDAQGFSYSARRLASGAAGSLVVMAVCWGFYRILLRAIDDQAWRWIKVGQSNTGKQDAEASGLPDDLAGRLRRLSAYLAAAVGLFLAAWVWDVDFGLLRFISEQPLPFTAQDVKGEGVVVTVGDLTKALLVVAVCAMAWRHMSTCFAVAVFPRIPDDPGIRFALVTLCRYAVLAVGLLCALSSVHLGIEKIGVVLAALGVGLGFGLQEIVSNFVCGIILLLERPIRVGDTVTVNGMTGKVERINIRATTITNGDNQSLIVPNRAFITGDLINWTLKDKVIRIGCKVKVAHGTDPDKVCELLLEIAHDDGDVLRSPLPAALMDEISDSSLMFTLSVHVPEPSLAGRVRHRLLRQIQIKFEDANIRIALPTQELRLHSLDRKPIQPFAEHHRYDAPSQTPPVPWLTTPRPVPAPVEDCHRGVDE